MSFPATFNLRYYKGDLYQFVVRPKTSTGEPFPISDETHNVFFYISPQRGGTASNTVTAAATIEDGNIKATIFPTIGNQLSQNTTYFYDVSVQRKLDTNEVYTIVTGSIAVTADITRPGS